MLLPGFEPGLQGLAVKDVTTTPPSICTPFLSLHLAEYLHTPSYLYTWQSIIYTPFLSLHLAEYYLHPLLIFTLGRVFPFISLHLAQYLHPLLIFTLDRVFILFTPPSYLYTWQSIILFTPPSYLYTWQSIEGNINIVDAIWHMQNRAVRSKYANSGGVTEDQNLYHCSP